VSQLSTEDRESACAGAIGLFGARFQELLHQLDVLLFYVHLLVNVSPCEFFCSTMSLLVAAGAVL